MYFLFFLFERNMFSKFFFFFQAEDGIRDGHVTGVQTCALPIWVSSAPAGADRASSTVVTTAAHSGVKSPFNTPAPPNVVSSRTDRSSNSPSGSLSGVSGRPVQPARQCLRGPPRQAQEERRQDQRSRLCSIVLVPPPGCHPPVGLDPSPEPRRDHHRMESGQNQGPTQSRPAGPPGVRHRAREE